MGHQGTCIKDTWTKPKGVGLRVGCRDGWGGGPSWGRNGDNPKKYFLLLSNQRQ